MLNKLTRFIRKYRLICPGDEIICAVSGGADSVALLFGLYLLKDKLGISLAAAHFNHHLRGEESDRDQAFVEDFCQGYGIPLHLGSAQVLPGKKGLESAARDARYAFLRALPGKIATAHTADDNAETVLMHLVRGTGLKGLGGIAPVNGNVIRPLLSVTRQEVEEFLLEWSLPHVLDSSNDTDAFLRNRIRHHVMPLLKEENPRLSENLSATALRLRQDEEALADLARRAVPSVSQLKQLPPALRTRALERFLKDSGVKEPEAEHLALAESLLFSRNPSASAQFPGNVRIAREYDKLTVMPEKQALGRYLLRPGQSITLEEIQLKVTCTIGENRINSPEAFTILSKGDIIIRCRESGDSLRLPGGTKRLKKLLIDRKIPAARRDLIPVVADDEGILGVWGIGANLDRIEDSPDCVTITFEPVDTSESC